jgi:PDZ domain
MTTQLISTKNFAIYFHSVFITIGFAEVSCMSHRERTLMPSKKYASLLLAFTMLMLAGCANQYKQYYRPVNNDVLQRAYLSREGPPLQLPIIERIASTETSTLIDRYARKGFAFIGHSSFNSGREEQIDSAIALAKEVNADLVVIVDPRYTGSQTTAIPLTTPTTTTSFSTGSATAYGPRGVVNAYGSGTTTTVGSVTNMVPVTIHRMDYSAAYFVKMKVRFGAFFRDLNDEERQRLQTNKGAVIRLVIDDSPAFRADLLASDIITSINGSKVDSSRALLSSLESQTNQEVKFEIIRGNLNLEKSVRLSN